MFCMQKVDKMFASFTGQPLDMVQQWTERDRFMSSSEVPFIGYILGRKGNSSKLLVLFVSNSYF
jgi:ATP-dependent protease ClpP protease subunit